MTQTRPCITPGCPGPVRLYAGGWRCDDCTASGFGGQLLLRSDDGYAQVMAASSERKFAAAGQVPGTWAWVHVRLPHQQRRMVSLQQ